MVESHAAAAHEDHGLLHHHFDDLGQQRESHTLGMWLFLMTEIMMFGGLFFSYTLYRWMFPGAFHVGSSRLNITLGTLNTFVLLFSSLTMAMAVHSAAERKRNPMILFLCLTWLLGAVFIGIKAFEWTADYNEGIMPAVRWQPELTPQATAKIGVPHSPEPTPDVVHHTFTGGAPASFDSVALNQLEMYFVFYFCMTGLHAIHMIVGLLIVGTIIWMGSKGKFTNGNDQPVEIVGLYWHFVDIVWVFLFPLLYLIAGFHPGGH